MKIRVKQRFLQVFIVVLAISFFLSLDLVLVAQPGMPPGHGQNGDQGAGGFAPIGEGLIVFMASAIAYGIRRILKKRKEK